MLTKICPTCNLVTTPTNRPDLRDADAISYVYCRKHLRVITDGVEEYYMLAERPIPRGYKAV